ncbi:LANO_0A07030g1_1 [Lachancea nothofagi CBS 11611]|uniref:LANO_0A07030g1_1 n=1 Tax=Lachancea nothofagi CBS 11611 TaxID=1266666 RepID=A0A1G4IS65_9SACH|nr:LANO_0A07030g1_1 [Lachancea nothofagi CBS 11611]
MTTTEPDRELTVDEEYDLWKSNVPLMYDFVSETKLLWPSLTIQWLPGNAESAQQELILGTHTSGEEQNYLKIASVTLPDEILKGEKDESATGQEDGGASGSDDQLVKSKIKIIKKFEHNQEITRARYAPFNNNLIATINGSGTVYLYDRNQEKEHALRVEFAFHKENGYGLNFSVASPGDLLSSSDDGSIALWDVQAAGRTPTKVDTNHTDIVNEAKWHETNPNMYGSVSEDKTLMLHDKRQDNPLAVLPQSEPFNTLAFSKHSINLFAAAGTDSQVYVYDLRKPVSPLHSMSGHQDAVTSLEFASHRDGILCSGGSDRRVLMWDLFQIGAEQPQEDADDGVPELLMMHAGHKSAVNDFSCNSSIPWLMASVEEENIVQIWKPSNKLTNPYVPKDYDIHSLE